MEHYQPAISFGEETARSYDRGLRGDEQAAVAFLKQRAGDGRALELAIGTGRIALPLAAEGVAVDGIDISQPMVDRLREKPGGERIAVTIGDIAEVPVTDRYRLIYVVFNSLYNLLTQDEQVRCFENVAAHLEPGGVFVAELFTPGYLHRLRDHQYVDAEEIRVDKVWLDVARHDPVSQRLEKNHVSFTADGIQLNPVVLRYAWPSELDLMARIAGLELVERHGGWERQPFDGRQPAARLGVGCAGAVITHLRSALSNSAGAVRLEATNPPKEDTDEVHAADPPGHHPDPERPEAWAALSEDEQNAVYARLPGRSTRPRA